MLDYGVSNSFSCCSVGISVASTGTEEGETSIGSDVGLISSMGGYIGPSVGEGGVTSFAFTLNGIWPALIFVSSRNERLRWIRKFRHENGHIKFLEKKTCPKENAYPPAQKAQIVLEAIREDNSMAKVAAENSVHPNQIHKWKRQALEDFAQMFEDDCKGERAREAEREKQTNELYAEIGRPSV